MGEKQTLETKVKYLKDKLTNSHNDLWSTDKLLWLTRSQLEVSKQSLKVALERGVQQTKTTSIALTTIATSKDESTEDLGQAKNIIDAQRLENFLLTQELMALKAELASAKAQLATCATKTIFIAPAIEQALPLQETHKDLLDTGGDDTDVPKE